MNLLHCLGLSTVFAILPKVNAFAFYFTSTPTQCAQTTVQWNGGQPPYTLLLVPTGHLDPETRTIIQRDITSGNSVSFVLDFPSGSSFVAVLNDATGVGAGGTSKVLTVADSSDTSCLNTQPVTPKFYFYLPSDIGQCDSIDISWQSTAQDPIDILALIPGGQSFLVANVTDNTDSFDWTANVRQGTNIMFVAGDKDGLGAGGSSDVLEISDSGNDDCIDESSPSSTGEPAAGGVSSTQAGEGTSTPTGTASDATSGGATPTNTDGGRPGTQTNPTSTDGSGSAGANPTNTGAGSTATNGGNRPTETNGGGNPTQGSGGDQPSSETSNVPGSGGGTVTGLPDPKSQRKHSPLGLILGLVFGLLAAAGATVGGVLYYRHRKRTASSAYQNLEPNTTRNPRTRYAWADVLTRGAHHIRGGAGSSIDTLPSMYQTEPFILPAEHPSYYQTDSAESESARPGLVARASSSRSVSNLLGDTPYSGDAFGRVLVGVHGAPAPALAPAGPPSSYTRPSSSTLEHKSSTGAHGRAPSRSASRHTLPLARHPRIPPPITMEDTSPILVARDSEDFSPPSSSPASANPYGEPVLEIPPSYQSVRRASMASRRGSVGAASTAVLGGEESGGVVRSPVSASAETYAGGPLAGLSGARLTRSNASRHSRRSMRSPTSDVHADGH